MHTAEPVPTPVNGTVGTTTEGNAQRKAILLLPFSVAIFTGAFLLFQVQPLIAKFILPWFGGTPAVWTSCMLFFQVMLLAGYAYAHLLTRTLPPRWQAVGHIGLLLLALVSLPIVPGMEWKPAPGQNPTSYILWLLAACIGLPYFVLSSTGPLLQEWFRRVNPGVSPYRLYALSNVGSLLALISFPFLFEPWLSRQDLATSWSWGLAAFALLCTVCAAGLWLRHHRTTESRVAPGVDTPDENPPLRTRALWIALPAAACVLLLATTNKLCQDVAVIPFLWVLPLALYLVTFIICFDGPKWYHRPLFIWLLLLILPVLCYALFQGPDLSLYAQIGIYTGGMFVACMVAHGELYRLRPHPRRLTSFYLLIATGGAVGGAFVALAAPLIFDSYVELHWGLGLLVLLLVVIAFREGHSIPAGKLAFVALPALALTLVLLQPTWTKLFPQLGATRTWVGIGVIVAALAAGAWLIRRETFPVLLWKAGVVATLLIGIVLVVHARSGRAGRVLITRSFYGVLRVFEYDRGLPRGHLYMLHCGEITHGFQFVHPEQRMWATSYFHERSGIGLALENLPRTGNRRVAVVGLGVGTLAAYSRAGDVFRFYEINPQMKAIAQKPFSYLKHATGSVEIVMGDARLSFEQESPQNYDLIALDAFSGDAIPVHLLTREAVALYLKHLRPDGVLAVQITNRHLDLVPVMRNLAKHFGLHWALVNYEDDLDQWWLYDNKWVLLTRNPEFLEQDAFLECAEQPESKSIPLWTDDYASLLRVLR